MERSATPQLLVGWGTAVCLAVVAALMAFQWQQIGRAAQFAYEWGSIPRGDC